MTKRERVVVDLAVQVLWEASEASDKSFQNTTAVRLALRVLLAYCPERWPLTSFWSSAGQEKAIGRSAGMTAAFNGTVLQLEKSGAWKRRPGIGGF